MVYASFSSGLAPPRGQEKWLFYNEENILYPFLFSFILTFFAKIITRV